MRTPAALIGLLLLVLVAEGWLWLRLDTTVERIVSGCLLSLFIAFWYAVFASAPQRRR